jgi:serine/arginine repetitive matrix protein 2
MRNAKHTISRAPSTDADINPQQHGFQIPSIRLHAATSAMAGLDSDAPTAMGSFAGAAPAVASPLAPRAPTDTRPRVVPKKSKLSLLAGRNATKTRENDLSDVARRVGAPASASTGRGFEIYVDPANDSDVGEIVVVKKQKSRTALGSIGWSGSGAANTAPLKDHSNLPTPVEKPALLKKGSTGAISLLTGKRSTGAASMLRSEQEDNQKWWSIGRKSKDGKSKTKGKSFCDRNTLPH